MAGMQRGPMGMTNGPMNQLPPTRRTMGTTNAPISPTGDDVSPINSAPDMRFDPQSLPTPPPGAGPVAAQPFPGRPQPPANPPLPLNGDAQAPGSNISSNLIGGAPSPSAPEFAPPPATSPSEAPGMMTTGRGLAGALGMDQNQWRAALAGVGKGLSAVGSMPRGATAGQSIAAGMGGGLTGNVNQQQITEATARQTKNDLFTQTSTAFRDMLAAKANERADSTAETNAAYRDTMGEYIKSQTASINAGTGRYGTGGANAASNNPYNQALRANEQSRKQEAKLRDTVKTNPELMGRSLEDQEKWIKTELKRFNDDMYKGLKLDPDKAAKLVRMGIEEPSIDGKPNPKFDPFDARKMGLDQWNRTVPKGGWYLDQYGKPQKREIGPGEEYIDKDGKKQRLPYLDGQQPQQPQQPQLQSPLRQAEQMATESVE